MIAMRSFTAAVAIALLAASHAAGAAEINTMVVTAMKPALDELVPQFEGRTTHKVRVTYGPSGDLVRRFKAGERTDMLLIATHDLDELMQLDKVLPGSTLIARSGIGIAVRKGARRPNVSTVDEVRRVLLDARSVAYTSPAAGGVTAVHLLQMFENLGIASEIAAKAKLAAGGPDGRVSTLVGSGAAEIGLQQVSELMADPAVDVIGLLPEPLQRITVHRAGVPVAAREPDAARELIRFLVSPDALTLYKAKGLGL
jgi:molybdate transport system substrate-binding protein